MGQEQVPFPHDSPNWALVRDLLTELQERLLNETINAQDAALHIQVIYEACQATLPLDDHWIQRQHDTRSHARHGARQKLDQTYLWYGMLKFLKKAERDESERFLFTTLPNIIELALRVEEHMPPGRLCYSQQQKGGRTVLSRQFIASILACSFLCLFPERVRDRTSRLNVVNFTNFFKQLPQTSQISKLRCIIHYFERTMDEGLERPGSITFFRQVADKSMLPTLDDLTKSEIALCSLFPHSTGVIEDVGSSAIQVDFANRSIGGGVLGRGRVQEEIRFSTCPELIAAMLFMENMEDNEAILITGFEQFSFCTGYAASLEFEGPFSDKAERDSQGNLCNTVCAIDATSFRWGGRHRQYMESFVLREINKALVGFSRMEHQRTLRLHPSARVASSEWEEEFVTAPESVDGEGVDRGLREVDHMAEVLSKSLLSQGMVEAVRVLTHDRRASSSAQTMEEVEGLHLDDVSLLSLSSENVVMGHSSSTPRDDTAQLLQVIRDDAGHSRSHGGNGERVSLPVPVPRPQNGSCDMLEVDYSEWLVNFRRRSSQLSDLTSRRSSSSTKHSSELSSDFEEIYETLVQAEKVQHGIIEEENYGAALSDYATHFVTSLVEEGTSAAAQMLPGMKDFEQGRPPAGTLRPQVVRPVAVRFDGDNRPPDLMSVILSESQHVDQETDIREDHTRASAGDDSARDDLHQSETEKVLAYIGSLVNAGIHNGMKEAATVKSKLLDDGNNDDIPDDVYRWFADKIVQEVFAHVSDELYFQRYTSDSRWRAHLPVNREGVQQRQDQSYSGSTSSSGSSEARQARSSLQSVDVGHRGSAEVQRSSRTGQESSGAFGVRGGSSELYSSGRVVMGGPDVLSQGRGDGGSQDSQSRSPRTPLHSVDIEAADQRNTKRKTAVSRTHSQLDSESTEIKERKEDKKSVTFTVGQGGNVGTAMDTLAARVSSSAAVQDIPASFRGPRSTVTHLYVVKDVPVPVTKSVASKRAKSPVVKEVGSPKSQKEAESSRSTREVRGLKSADGDPKGSDTSGSVVISGDKHVSEKPRSSSSSSSAPSSSSSSSFITTATSSIPQSLSAVTETDFHPTSMSSVSSHHSHSSPASPAQTTSTLCDTTTKPADPVPRSPAAFVRYPKPGAVKFLSSLDQQRSLSGEENISSVPSPSTVTSDAGQASGLAAAASSQTSAAELDQGATSEQVAAASLSSRDLNLDCYRAAAAIVNQVFQSLPDHLTQSELQSLQGSPSSFYYHGRKYESIIPRGSYETAAAVIGASEKGNVVSENYIQNKAVTAAATSGATSPRRTRSQSPCFSWLSKRLSRETLTNAFVKVESRQTVKSYERRSSEPCQRSVTLSLQAFNTSRYGYSMDSGDEKRRKNGHIGDELDMTVKENSWRRGSLDSISLSRRRSSCGFKDPVLSRFAQELITADTSVPQLFLVGSDSTTSTTGSRRSSMSGFRDTTLATFESELLNSSFTFSQGPTSPRHRRPKRSHSRESRLWKSDSSETEHWFPIPRRVGHEFQEQMERVHRHYSVDEIEDYADFIATTILQQAVSILYHDMEEMTQEDLDISIFSENLADQILREAMITSIKLSSANTIAASAAVDTKHHRRRGGKPKSVSDSELDFSVSSNDLTARSLEDRLTDFQDALDTSYDSLETYAGHKANLILSSVLEEFGAAPQRLVPGGRAIATGNWGCGAFRGDPCLKVALQWVAASVAQSPRLLYFTFGDPRLYQLPAVVEMLSQQHWTVGQLMAAVRAYCVIVLDEVDSWSGGGGDMASAARGRREVEGFVPAQTLFDFLLMQP